LAGSSQLWRWYESRTAELFKRVKGAQVEENVRETGVGSGQCRQIDVRVMMPVEVTLLEQFTISVPIKLIVDCKHYNRRLGLKTLGEIAELKDDVQAQLAIAVSPLGVTKGAGKRAPSLGVYPMAVTDDLLALLGSFRSVVSCLMDMCFGSVYLGKPQLEGTCIRCGTLHVRCRDCFVVFAIPDPDGTPLACPGECGAVCVADYDGREDATMVRFYDVLDTRLLRAAHRKSNRRLTARQVNQVVRSTRWQYWTVASPTIGLTEESLMEWENDNLCLTSEGARVVQNVLDRAEPVLWY